MKTYELALVLHPDLEIDIKPTLKKVEEQIIGLGGKVKSQDSWGKQKLAYQLAKQSYGIYAFYTIELEPVQTKTLEENLRLEEAVMRHLLVNMDEKALAVLAERAKGGDGRENTSYRTSRTSRNGSPAGGSTAEKQPVSDVASNKERL